MRITGTTQFGGVFIQFLDAIGYKNAPGTTAVPLVRNVLDLSRATAQVILANE
jgi:hypothetical protein